MIPVNHLRPGLPGAGYTSTLLFQGKDPKHKGNKKQTVDIPYATRQQ